MGAFVNRSFIVPYLNGGQVVHVLLAASPLFSRSLELRQGSPFHPFVSDDGSSRRKLRAESHAPDTSRSLSIRFVGTLGSAGAVPADLCVSEASTLSRFLRRHVSLASVILPSASLYVSTCLFGALTVFPLEIIQEQRCDANDDRN